MANMEYMGMATMTTTARWLDFKITGQMAKWLQVLMAGYFDVQMANGQMANNWIAIWLIYGSMVVCLDGGMF